MTIKPAKVSYDNPPATEFFKSLFTLGGYKARNEVRIVCGFCRAKFSGTVEEDQNFLSCPACGRTNIWD